MGKKSEVFSFSKLSSFHTCPYAYYLNYVYPKRKEINKKENAYGILGSSLHELAQALNERKITKEEALVRWQQDCDFAELMDYDFPTEKAKHSYIESVRHYLENFETIKGEEVHCEEYFIYEVNGIQCRGFIDLYIVNNERKEITVIDFKTSTKFSKKDLYSEKVYQLILYAMYLESEYEGYRIKNIYFDMVKYARDRENGRVYLRSDIMLNDPSKYKRFLLAVPYDDEQKQRLIDYVTATVDEVNTHNKRNPKDWEANSDNDFYCSNLCSFYEVCEFCKK